MRFILLFVITILSFSCGSKSNAPTNLKLIPPDQIINRAKAGTFDYRYAKFKTRDGDDLNEEQQNLLNEGLLGKDYYEDENGVIKEIRIRPLTLEDKFIEIQRRELFANPMQGIQIVDINCDSLDAIYAEIYRTDQDARKNGGDIAATDTKNLQTVVSVFEKCGLTEAHKSTIWLVFHKAPSGILAYYYSHLKKFSGASNASSVAMMEDRLLMEHGYKQLYGTQIVGSVLYKLEDPDNVNQRRAAMGLGKIENYIGGWNLDFESEKERMKNEE